MRQKLDDIMKGRIISYIELKYSIREISKKTKIPKSTVARFAKKVQNAEYLYRKKGSGRPSILNDRKTQILTDLTLQDPKMNAKEIKHKFEQKTGVNMSQNSVVNYLSKAGIYCYVARTKPKLTKKQKDLRYQIVKKYISYENSFWSKVIFSDEATFQLMPNQRKAKIYRKKGAEMEEKNLIHSTKFGKGKVMIWACMSEKGVGRIAFIKDSINAGVYINILSNNLKKSADKIGIEDDFILQHDGARPHTAKDTEDFILLKGWDVLPWAPQSPDLNPIENLFAYLKRKLIKKSFKNINELCIELEKEWYNIPNELCKKLVDSMPNRSLSVYKARGGNTKY